MKRDASDRRASFTIYIPAIVGQQDVELFDRIAVNAAKSDMM